MGVHRFQWLLAAVFCLACAGDPDVTTPGQPSRLAFLVPPTNAALGAPLTPGVRVEVQDEDGRRVTSAVVTIELALAEASDPTILTGSRTVEALEGVAAFDDLVVEKVEARLTLVATAPGLDSATSPPFDVSFLLDQIAAGDRHTCAAAPGGRAYCWGSNDDGQLGDGEGAPKRFETTPQRVVDAPPLVQVATGTDQSCGLTASGEAWCWGSDASGQLGDGPEGPSSSAVPLPVAGALTFVALALQGDHSCGLTDNGAAWCWGYNASGELGVPELDSSHVPVPVQGGLRFDHIAAGSSHNCGTDAAGAAWCWGNNQSGQLGDGSRASRSEPAEVSGGLRFEAIAAGGRHTCGVTTQGASYCWGSGLAGALGSGSEADGLSPTVVAGGPGFVQLVAGELHTCGLTDADEAWCWGSNADGRLGDDLNALPLSLTPVAVAGDLVFARLALGSSHTCGITITGQGWCWGSDARGQLGNGPPEDVAASTPDPIADPDGA